MPRVRAGATGLRKSVYTVDEIAQAVEGGLGAQEALAISVGTENEDFTFSESLEAEAGALGAMDDEDGVTANWSSEETKRVRCVATAVVDEGSGLGAVAPTLGDTVDLQVWVNEAVVLTSDEGASEAISSSVTFTIDDVMNITGGDKIRLVLETGAASETADYDVAAAGEFDLVPVD